MTFTQGILRARSHIIFILALATAFTMIIYLDALGASRVPRPISSFNLTVSKDSNLASPTEGLSEDEELAAVIAWQYFKNNYQPETGFVNSADRYTSTTMWDQSSYLLAIISAYKLGVIDAKIFDTRVSKLLSAFATIPLFENKLPNKAYSTITMEMTDYNNNSSERGIGWSALDIGRLATPLNVLLWNYPQYTEQVQSVLKHWHLEAMIENGYLFGTRVNADDKTERVQEGRIGYEEYSASALMLLAYDVKQALEIDDFIQFENIYGVEVPYDVRDFKNYGAHNYVVSEPYILAGLEYGLTRDMKELAYRVYAAQERRYINTGILTAVSEDNIDRAPYFVYNTVYTNGAAWSAITEDGKDARKYKTISTKAAFGWDALYNNTYTDKLMEKVMPLHDPERGFYSGWYEELDEANEAITANSNGIILESLHYKKFGQLVSFFSNASENNILAVPENKDLQTEDLIARENLNKSSTPALNVVPTNIRIKPHAKTSERENNDDL